MRVEAPVEGCPLDLTRSAAGRPDLCAIRRAAGPDGALLIGSADEVTAKDRD
jgi:hypothetical protein